MAETSKLQAQTMKKIRSRMRKKVLGHSCIDRHQKEGCLYEWYPMWHTGETTLELVAEAWAE